MNPDDPRGKRDVLLGDLLRTAVLVPSLPPSFGEEIQRHLVGIDEDESPAGRLSRRRPRRWVLLAAAVLVALAVAVVVVGSRTAGEYVQPEPASAAEVVARARSSLAGFRTISATVSIYSANTEGPTLASYGSKWTSSAQYFALARVEGSPKLDALPSHLVATSQGQVRHTSPLPEHLSTPDPEGKLTLRRNVAPVRIEMSDAQSGTRSLYVPSYSYTSRDYSYSGQGEIAIEYVDTALGPPDSPLFTSGWATMMDQANALALLANGTVSKTTYDGRPALVVSAAVTPGPVVVNEKRDGYSVHRDYDRVEVTVDKATWFPVRYTTSLHGKINHDARLTDVQLDVPVEDRQFEPKFPSGARAGTVDEGFRRVGAGEAAHAFSYRPLAPASLPPGFSFSLAAVAPESVFELWVGHAPTLDNRRRVVTHDVTALDYRAGFLSFTVTTRREEGTHSTLLADPFEPGPTSAAAAKAARTVELRGGALTGERARLSLPATGVPHLWAFHDGLLVTVGGDLTERQLIAVAESLQPLD